MVSVKGPNGGSVDALEASQTVSGSPVEKEILPQHDKDCDVSRGHGLHRCSCSEVTQARMRLARAFMWQGGWGG